MKASELRIGNWVNFYDDGSTKIETALQIHLDHNHYEPIPLTEEWLLKFGFEENEYLGYKLYQKIYEDNLRIFTVGVKTKRGYEFDGWKQLKYVHQLQNLYHALCGHELKTKQDDK